MNRGVTLTELLVWLAVVGVLAGCLFIIAKGTRAAGESQLRTANNKLGSVLRDLDGEVNR